MCSRDIWKISTNGVSSRINLTSIHANVIISISFHGFCDFCYPNGSYRHVASPIFQLRELLTELCD
jgi:hypothetical protein